jgi:hypothetical protein
MPSNLARDFFLLDNHNLPNVRINSRVENLRAPTARGGRGSTDATDDVGEIFSTVFFLVSTEIKTFRYKVFARLVVGNVGIRFGGKDALLDTMSLK